MNEQDFLKRIHWVFDASLPRLGPGDELSTQKALGLALAGRPVNGASEQLRILDLGCGNGAQTLHLVKHVRGDILAVDNYQPYLDELKRRAEFAGVSKRIRIQFGDMREVQFAEGSFDLIWSEGALNLMGFSDGLAVCHRLLAPGGQLAVTELCWLKPDPPGECRDYFMQEYPAIKSVDDNLRLIADCGYKVLGHFPLPRSSWWEQFYQPLENRLRELRGQPSTVAEKLAFVETMEKQIEIFRKYFGSYGYEFFVMQR